MALSACPSLGKWNSSKQLAFILGVWRYEWHGGPMRIAFRKTIDGTCQETQTKRKYFKKINKATEANTQSKKEEQRII